MRRNRVWYSVATGGVVALGLASRSSLVDDWPVFLQTYLGDALWALMVFLGFATVFRRLPTWLMASLALGFSFGIEFSQLYQEDWIVRLRETRLGALVLGHGFLFSDLLGYSVGIAAGVVGELLFRGVFRKQGPSP